MSENGSNGAVAPPQNIEAEESVLGAMMISEGAINAVTLDVRLEPEDFYRPRHRLIFEAIRSLNMRGEPVDSLTVPEALAARGQLEEAGGREFVQQLPNQVPAPGNARHYGEIVKQNAMLRRLLETSQSIQKSVLEREGMASDLVERAESMLFKVAHDDRSADFAAVEEVISDEIDKLEAIKRGERTLSGTHSGFRDLDNLLGGFQPGNLIVLAARPAMGKSALVCNIAENVALSGKPVALFSLEMSRSEIAMRILASQTRIANDRLRKVKDLKEHEWKRVLDANKELASKPLWIDDSSDLSMLDLRAKSRRLAANQGQLGLIIVDYMQLMRPDDPRMNRVEQVGQISRGLKILAGELNVPVIGLSQLSRAPEHRAGGGSGGFRPDDDDGGGTDGKKRNRKGRPVLSDLRESGNIEQDADVVMFIYRESIYNPEADESEAEIIFAKHRNGPIADIDVIFHREYPRFGDRVPKDIIERAPAMTAPEDVDPFVDDPWMDGE